MDKENLIFPEPSDYLKNLQGLWTVVPLNCGIIVQIRTHSLGPDLLWENCGSLEQSVCNCNGSFPVLFFPRVPAQAVESWAWCQAWLVST